jgi:hypothetical protein
MTVEKNWCLSSTSLVFDDDEANGKLETVFIPGNDYNRTKDLDVNSDSFEDDDSDEVDVDYDVDELAVRKRRSHSKQKLSWSLCSIPEDKNVGPAFFLVPRRCHAKVDDDDSAYEEDEPIFHRSPVSLENGYKPAGAVLQLRIIQSPGDEPGQASASDEEFSFALELSASTSHPMTTQFREKLETQPDKIPIAFRLMVCLFHLAVSLLVISVCLVSVTLILLLTFHHFR